MELFEHLKELHGMMEQVYENPDAYGRLYGMTHAEAQYELKDFTQMKDLAVLGDQQARNFMINQYTNWLSDYFRLQLDQLDQLITVKKENKNHCRVTFEMLLAQYDLSQLIEKYQWRIQVTQNELEAAYDNEYDYLKKVYEPPLERIKILAALIYAYEDGQDAIDSIQHHSINEIGALSHDYIYIVYKGKKIRLSFLSFPDSSTIINIQKKSTRNSKVQYDEQNPTVVASKNNSNRITVAGYAATPTHHDLFYNERIFNLKKITLEELRDHYGTLDETIYQLIMMNQKGRGSYLVSGSDMGIGKSTFLTATIEKVPDFWGIGILDSQDELQIRKKYPWKNVITLIENPKRTIEEQFQTMLKMARDVLFVGEITSPEEISQLLNSSLRLNAGVGGTIHLISPYEAVANCRNLLMGTAMYDQSEKAEEDIARGINLVFHLNKLPTGKIVVDKVLEICYLDNHQESYSLLTQVPSLSNLMTLTQRALGKYLYQRCYQYNEIIAFDYQTNTWQKKNLPSQSYFSKIRQYVTQDEISSFQAAFNQPSTEGR